MSGLQVVDLRVNRDLGLLGSRPTVQRKTGQTLIRSPRGLVLNSALRKDEWEELDRAVVAASVPPLAIVSALVARGLTRTLGSLGTMSAQYNQASEMTAATANLRGHSSVEKDLVDFNLVGVPVPVIFKEFELDARALASSRQMGEGIDVTNAAAAARVVAEKIEDMMINGDANINLLGGTIYGLTTHPNRVTNTATGFGGGAWTTNTNVTGTIAGMISALQANAYYGPYGIFAAPAAFNNAALTFFTDGSGDSPRDRVLRMANVAFFEQSPQLAAGVVLVIDLSSDVVQVATLPGFFPITNREWTTGDGMLLSFKAMAVYTPIVKAAYGGKSGIAHATGA